MNEKVVCEVLLKSYKDLETLSENCDKNILDWALKTDINVLNVVEYINKNIIKKTAYCNIKVILDEAIKNIGHCDELKYKYFQGLKLKDLSNKNDFEIKVRNQKRKLFNYLTRKHSIEKLFNLIKDSNVLMYRYCLLLKNNKQKF